MSSNCTDLFDLLVNRDELIHVLSEEPMSQSQLVAQTDASQSTVSRTLTRYQELGLITETDGNYELTLFGDLVHQKHTAYMTELAELYDASEILRELPAEVSLDPAVLADAEITMSKSYAPDAAISPLLRLTRQATAIKCAAATIHAGYVAVFDERMTTSDLEAEFIVTETVAEQSIEDYDDRKPTPVQTGRLDLYTTEDDLPFSLLIIDTPDDVYTVIVVCSGAGKEGTIINSNDAAHRWAHEQYTRVKSDAVRWELP